MTCALRNNFVPPVYARIIIALDGSPLAEEILPHVATLAEKFDSTVILLRAVLPIDKVAALVEPSIGAVPIDPSLIEETVETELEEAERYLEHVANSLRPRGIKVQTERPAGSATDAIVDSVRRNSAELIALTTPGGGGLCRLVFGRVSDGVLRQAPG